MRRFCLPLLALLLLPAAASAGLVQPGESQPLNSIDFASPSGTMLDSMTTPFTIDYGMTDPVSGFDGKLHGSLHSSVYNVGGKLAFLYDIDLNPANTISGAAEGSNLRVSSFAGFSTFLTGSLDFEELILASRSADGATVGLASDTPGLGGPPRLLVQTDATAFDKGGLASFFAADELSTGDGTAPVQGEAAGLSTFRPVPARPHAIPLPPAFYSGLGVLLALGLIAATRRVWNVPQT